ncbi:MAG: hypothetical protein HY445_00285 [Candidatus Niyogibacteria bacterium]|nr:hypothetical protein [Candidatus Niyogibacteria bacterium]
MKSSQAILRGVVIVFVLFAFMYVRPLIAGEIDDVVNAPKFAVEDSWEYKTATGRQYTVMVVEVNNDSHAITVSYEPNVRFRRNKDLVIQEIEGPLSFDRRIVINWKYIDFPAKVGKQFSYRVEGSRGAFSIDTTVAGWETIRVPAGDFRALKLESCWRNESSGWYDCGMKYWYSPEVRSFVKRQTPAGWFQPLRNSDFELITFKLQ